MEPVTGDRAHCSDEFTPNAAVSEQCMAAVLVVMYVCPFTHVQIGQPPTLGPPQGSRHWPASGHRPTVGS